MRPPDTPRGDKTHPMNLPSCGCGIRAGFCQCTQQVYSGAATTIGRMNKMRLSTVISLSVAILFSFVIQSYAGPGQSTSMQGAMCFKSIPAQVSSACSVTTVLKAVPVNMSYDKATLTGQGEDRVVYDRCPPGSDAFCPAGAYCCQNASGQYRCCK